MKKKIIRRQPIETAFSSPDMHPVLQRVYTTRGIQSEKDLEYNLQQLLPYQDLLGINTATTCLTNAIQKQASILVIGDFDADGATSTALAVSALKTFGAKFVSYLVPNRFEYGYGLTPEIVAVAAKQNPSVIVTVDNGISSHEGVAAAKAAGIDVVITDHHLPGTALPEATAIVNPQLPGDPFASKNLAGVGVIFYVMLALRAALRQQNWFIEQNIPEPNMGQFLDLVALGTVADLVPLDHNNRILVHQGIQRIRCGKARTGIQALLTLAKRSHQQLIASDLGFAIAPRLNAAGRLSDMSLGIECLLATDLNKAHEMATQLGVLNEERRYIERDMQDQAFTVIKKLQEKSSPPVGICLFDENWHQGIIGLLASRIKEFFHRPVIAFAPGNTAEELKGSARSIPGLHIRDLLDRVATHYPGLITRFGGHAMAAGLTLSRTAYPAFCNAFSLEIKQQLDPAYLQGELHSDGELLDSEFCIELARQLRESSPWGQTFPEPLFDGYFKILDQRIVGNKHLKLTITPKESNRQLDAIAFNVDIEVWPNHQTRQIHAAYRLDINEYLGRTSVQLVIEQLEAI